MDNRVSIPAWRKRYNSTLQEKEISIEITKDGINIAATGTITFRSAIVLAEALLGIALSEYLEEDE